MSAIIPQSIASQIQTLAPSAVIELFVLDMTVVGGPIVTYHGGTNGVMQPVIWQGVTYYPFPVEASGFEYNGKGTLPRPKIQIANLTGAITALILQYGDLVGCKLTRKRTLSKYLDSVNFPAVEVANGQAIGTGNGVNARFQLIGPDGYPVIQNVAITSIFRNDWQGNQPLYPTPRTNLLVSSQNTANAAWNVWSNCTHTENVLAAPDGTTTASQITRSVAKGVNTYVESTIQTGVNYAGQTMTWSIYLKLGTYDGTFSLFLRDYVGTNYAAAKFNLATSVVSNVLAGSTAAISNAGGGWFRCSITGTFAAAAGAGRQCIVDPDDNGSAAGPGDYYYMWGGQFETGNLTPYIPTSTAAVTVTDYGTTATRTNLLSNSQAFDNAAWSKLNSAITAAAIAAPDGTLTGEKLADNSTVSVGHSVAESVASANAQATFTQSVYAKASDRAFLTLRMTSISTPANYCSGAFNLSNGTCTAGNVGAATGAAVSMVAVGGGWYRCSVSGVADPAGTAGINAIMIAPLAFNATSIYAGTVGAGIYIWGAQLEAGAAASPYIPTTTAAAAVTDPAVSAAGVLTLAVPPAAGATVSWTGSGTSVFNPTADPTASFPDDVFFLEQKTAESRDLVEFQIAAAFDFQGLQLPRRPIVQNVCVWRYRGAECGWTGGNFDINDNATNDPTQDQCSKRLSGCRCRYGQNAPLPYGSFPAAGVQQ